MSVLSAKSSWIFCARVSLLLVLTAGMLALPAEAKKKKKKGKKPTKSEELFNPMLGMDYSYWLVGAVVEIATLEEVERYLSLVDDEDAALFIEEFWDLRAEGFGLFEKKPRQIFDERSLEADKLYSEGVYPGRRTDRGKIFILHGEPEEVEYDTPDNPKVPVLEVWTYPKDAPEGIDGEKPKRSYRFVELNGSKVLYSGQTLRFERNDLRNRNQP